MSLKEVKDKYVWWGLLGIGVAFMLYFLTRSDIQKQTVKVPYLVPSTVPPSSISEQDNMVGTHPGSNGVTNGTIPSTTTPTNSDFSQYWNTQMNVASATPRYALDQPANNGSGAYLT